MAGQSNSKVKLSPKLMELCKSSFIDTVNAMLDAGESPNQVCRWINGQGFKISVPLVYEYSKIRKQCIINNINMDTLIGVAKAPNVTVERSQGYDERQKKVKSEIEALDRVIQLGYDSLERFYGDAEGSIGKPVPIATMLAAIQLKNNLTEGSHGFLTKYGLEQLREVEQQKYAILFDTLMSFIPESQRDIVTEAVNQAEDEYYQTTDYYIEYLKAKGMDDEAIAKRLEEVRAANAAQDAEADDDVTLKI